MLNASLLVPVPPLLLLAGALLAARPPDALARLQRGLVVCMSLSALCVAVVLAVWLWRVPDALVFPVSPWSPAVFGGGPQLHVDLLAALCVCLVSGASLFVVVRGQAGEDESAVAGPLLVTAASALFVTAADSPLGLVFAWLLLDLTLFVSGEPRFRGLLLGQFGLALAVVGLLGLPFDAGLTDTGLANVDATGRRWLLGAAAVRIGLYPLWWLLPRTGQRHWRSVGFRLAPTLAGLYIVLRLAEGFGPFDDPTERTLIPLGVALLGGGLLAWLAANRGESMDWQLTYHASLLVAAVVIGGSVGMGIALVLVLDLILTRVVLFACEGLDDGPVNRMSRWVATASASALPPTLGFAARWLLYRELLVHRQYGFLIVTVVAGAFATMALWDTQRLRVPTGRTSRATSALLIVLAAALVVLGIALASVGPAIEALGARAPVSPLVELWSMLTVEGYPAPEAIQLLVLILLPTVMAVAVRRTPLGWIDRRRRHAREALKLTAIVDVAASAVIRAGETVHRATGLLESERAMAWTLMAVAVTGTAMLVGVPGTSAPSVSWTWPMLVPFAIACVLSALMLFGTSPGMCLIALAGGYLLSTGMLLRGDGLALVGLIQLLVGALVIGILTISVLEASGVPTVRALLQRLFAVSSRAFEEGSPGMMALVLAVGLILTLGVRAQTLSEVLPDDVLRAGLALIVGGALTAVFARHPLRLAAAVLFTLAGFGMIYAHVDPGLFITGFLAAFHLLFALVASYHVGLAVEAENP